MAWGTPNVGSITDSGAGIGTSIVVSLPAGVQDGDILLAHILHGSGISTLTPPAGWTLVKSGNIGDLAGFAAYVYVRVASSEPASYTWTISSSRMYRGVIVAVSGGDSTTPVNDSQVATAAGVTTAIAPSVTTTRDGNMVAVFAAGKNGSNSRSWTFPGSLTERYDTAGDSSIAGGTAIQATAGASGTFSLTPSASADVVLITVALNYKAPIDLSGDIVGSGVVTGDLSVIRGLSGQAAGSGVLVGSLTRKIALSGDIIGAGIVTGILSGGSVALSGDIIGAGVVTGLLGYRRWLTGDLAGSGQVAGSLSYLRWVSGDAVGAGQVTAGDIALIRALIGPIVGTGIVGGDLSFANRVFGRRLRLDVFSPAGALVTRIPVVFGAEYRLGQDEVGEFSLSLPAADERVSLLAAGQRVILYREGEGRVFAGIVGKREAVQDAEGGELLAVTGASRARELVRRNTMTGASYEGETVAAIATDLLAGTGWAVGDIATDPAGVTILGIGKSYWEMLAEVATRKGWHIRENNLAATVDIGPFGASSGLVVRNIAQARGWSDLPLNVLPLTGIKITEQQEELVNQVVILGGGEGPNALTLRYATRSTPYEVKQAVDQRGNPYWYLEDEASILAHGLHQGPPVVFKDIIPLANSAGSFEAAANALYEMGTSWLRWHAEPVESYEIQFVGLRHYDHGAAVLNPGDTLRLQYRGYVAREADGTTANRVYRDINAELHVLDMRRSFAEDGSDTWQVTVSTSDQRAPDDTALMAETYARLHSVETALRPYTVPDTVGPLRDSVDSTHPFRMDVTFDDNVTYLLQAKLEILVRPVRSNTKGAASGGGGTGVAGGSHSHTINAQTTGEDSSPRHWHEVAYADVVTAWSTPAYQQQLLFYVTPGGTYFGPVVGRNGTTPSSQVLYTIGGSAHSHSISATTSQEGGQHSHPLSPHTHALQYGIFEGPNPSNPDLRLEINGVDVTSALGGPWDDDVTLDVTQYLVDETQQVLRQNHTFEVSSNVLADVIVSLKSILTIVGVHPV